MVTAFVFPACSRASRIPRMPAPVRHEEELLDPDQVDWDRVAGSRFVLRQRMTYVYDGPIHHLRHRLMVVPPVRHGDQVRVDFGIAVTGADHRIDHRVDTFGNHRIEVRVARVAELVAFETWAVAERTSSADPVGLDPSALHDARLLQPSPLTWPDDALEDAARRLRRSGLGGADLARSITTWVYRRMRYRPGATNIDTTAARAFGMAQGVCQDYAHVMLCLCRLCGLPARYVSGHLLGEGGSHAWVEVIVPDPSGGPGAVALPLDPTHGREVGPSYLTVAVGREYSDVAPTYGTYSGDGMGVLSTVKRVGVTAVELTP